MARLIDGRHELIDRDGNPLVGNAKNRAKSRRPGTRVGVPLGDCRLLTVTARLGAPVALDPVWPQTLDGLLASIARRERLGADYGLVVDHHVEHLPLGRLPTKSRWVWLATCAQPVDGRPHLRHWAKRTDAEPAERVVASRLNKYITSGGRYRDHWSPLPVTISTGLRWHCIGDPIELDRLLQHALWVGKKRSQGIGRVVDWDVIDHLQTEPGVGIHLGHAALDPVLWWPTGHPARPIPHRHAADLGVPDAAPYPYGYRPPYFGHARYNGNPKEGVQDVIHPATIKSFTRG